DVQISGTSASLTANVNELSVSEITFQNIETADLNSGSLTGTSGNDVFNITASNEVTTNAIGFTSVASVDAGAGDADEITSDITVAATLTGTNALNGAGIDFSNIEKAGLNSGSLTGTSGNDVFNITASNEVTANAIGF
ncbi:hypothetical protein, partial [Thalassolituus oleivorans]|uniref:hypothetical protein n=1 Tax=Thalassolituus oleivorans TaxID=187493 RepID=UPI0023F3AA90